MGRDLSRIEVGWPCTHTVAAAAAAAAVAAVQSATHSAQANLQAAQDKVGS
jgi:hypothetical protein